MLGMCRVLPRWVLWQPSKIVGVAHFSGCGHNVMALGGHRRGLRRRMNRPVAGGIQWRLEIVVCAMALESGVACRCDREVCVDV